MSQAAVADVDEVGSSDFSVGKYWAAIRDEKAVGLISMRVPSDVDFEAYRQKATDCLGMLGEVKSGELVIRSGGYLFVQRKTHANRSKKNPESRKAKEFQVQF